jgi:hypothetical protein
MKTTTTIPRGIAAQSNALSFRRCGRQVGVKRMSLPLLALLLAALLSGCGPPKVLDVVEIKPNATCWVIPLDSANQSAQTKFNSVGFLEEKKVATKRVMVDKVQRQTGRMWWDYEWIPAVRVITVDRSLVTREWTDSDKTGTSTVKQGIPVITKDSIKLTVGLTITANIEEEDASKYLYYHGEKPLSDVVDQNLRSFAVAELTRQFSSMNLQDAQQNQTEIYSNLFHDAVLAFKQKGITIQYLGNAEGMEYNDQKIQEGINLSYAAQQDIKTAEQQQQAIKIRNETKIMEAEAEATAAGKLEAAKEAATLKNLLEIKMIEAKARMLMASNWNGQLPRSILPANSPLLLNLSDEGDQAPGAKK